MDFQQLLSRFCNVRQTGETQYLAQCPAHEDLQNSLSIGLADTGLTIVHCHAGCSTVAVLAAVQLNPSDLYPLVETAPSKKGGGRRRQIVATYDYTDAAGKMLYQVVRMVPKDFKQRQPDPESKAGWSWSMKGVDRVLYRLHEIAKASPATPIFVAEGEKDADRLGSLGLVATCNVGGAGKWIKKYGNSLIGRNVAIIPDRDEAGRNHAIDVAAKLDGAAAGVVVIHLPELGPKEDVSDWLDHGGTAEQLRQYAAKPPPEWPTLPATAADVAEDESGARSGTLSNAAVEWDDGVAKVSPLPMEEIIASLYELTNGWPRRVESALFVHEADGIHWLENSSSLFGWLSRKTGVVEWRKAVGCVSKDELYQQLRRSAEAYLAIEHQPHFPPMAGHYYACTIPPSGGGEAIAALVGQFAATTPHDEMLILALFVTVFWGGSAGRRPAFLITSDDGRGVGKSILTDMVARLAGGHIELSPTEDAARLRTRLLSPRGLVKRVARLDNVKTLRFSWADLESIITSATISGHRLHIGEADRPNNLTWLITLNGPSLGTDIAQRVIVIKIQRPERIEAWEADTLDMIDAHRNEIIGDIRGFFDLDPQPIPHHGRWATWEGQVLGRLVDPVAIQQALFERAEEADVELEEIETIENYFAEKLNELSYLPSNAVHISNKIACDWFNESLNEKRSTTKASQIIRQFCKEKRTRWLTVNLSKKRGRGFIFQLEFSGAVGEILYDLEERIDRNWPSRGHF